MPLLHLKPIDEYNWKECIAPLPLILPQLQTRCATHPLWLSFHPDNKSAITETGLESAEELCLKLDLEQLDTAFERSSQ